MPSLTAASADRWAVELLALALAAIGTLLLRRHPRLAVLSYLLVLAFVPVWAGVTVKVYFEPQVLWGLLVLAVLLTAAGRLRPRSTAADGLVAGFLLVSLAPLLVGGATLSGVFVLVVQWTGAYAVGRLAGHRVGYAWCLDAIAVVFTVVGALAVVEYLTGVDLFLSIPGSAAQFAEWGTLQERGGVLRAEGAFGHSIALGAALAMAVPMALASGFRVWIRIAMVLVMVSGVAVTFSRIGLVSVALGIVLSIVSLRELPARLRGLLAGAVTVAAAALYPIVAGVFTAAGDEATNSAAYRGDLLSLVGQMRALGVSAGYHVSPTGHASFGGFRSIDSALILQGLTYGWLSLALVLLLLALGVGAVLLRRASAPAIALVAQIPALATVALITQYSTMIWFVAGLAVFAAAERRASAQRVVDLAPPAAPGAVPAGTSIG